MSVLKHFVPKAMRPQIRASLKCGVLYRVRNWHRTSFVCPVCSYSGPFRDQFTGDTVLKNSFCPQCDAMERHRLQYLAMQKLAAERDFSQMSMLHFAPEDFFREPFRKWFRKYVTADLYVPGVDYRVDITQLPFPNGSFDCVFASHVMEYIRDDSRGLSEIKRILTPTGIAVLPVPVYADTTIEYPGEYEHGHIRAPGPDYFDRYRKHFPRVEILKSDDFPSRHQVFIFEDRSIWPTKERPYARPMPGDKHVDFVPVCYATDEKKRSAA